MNLTNETMAGRQVYTISRLTENIKEVLEENFSFIWITGEISNRYIPASGHCYFNLKDESSQIRAVIFRGQVRHLKFEPENGMSVIGLGRISVYPPQGTYQVILEYLEPAGAGALHIAFEQLKKRLDDEGLFDEQNKSELPPMPGTIGVVTSLSGAVIHDMMNVLFRRFENIHLLIAPAKVQGTDAEDEIAGAIELLNRHGKAEIIILARGGGSIEDLQAFNSETVARAIHASAIPVVSAVGHEVDYTIADFTADLRAPTPSAAAELVVPEKYGIINYINRLTDDLSRLVHRRIAEARMDLDALKKRVKSPRQHIEDLRLRVDHLANRLTIQIIHQLDRARSRTAFLSKRLDTANPDRRINNYKVLLEQIKASLCNIIQNTHNNNRYRLEKLERSLNALSPMAILERGYSITRTTGKEGQSIVKNADTVETGQQLEILLARGLLRVTVRDKIA
ncbi:MAG: exodeoxyribonuclease VII large subunit [Deltaproteobacteria bacterium]|nr:MAG: exodeoxyribonuclease VII large subunit [Deltaproteobacteria bacterium]